MEGVAPKVDHPKRRRRQSVWDRTGNVVRAEVEVPQPSQLPQLRWDHACQPIVGEVDSRDEGEVADAGRYLPVEARRVEVQRNDAGRGAAGDPGPAAGIVLIPGVEGRTGEMELQADEGLRVVVWSRGGEAPKRGEDDDDGQEL